MTLLGRIFKLPPKLTSLLAIGSSICGVTAIMAAQGAIEPEEEDTSTAIAAILTLGAIALFTFPAIGHCCTWASRPTACGPGLPSTTPPSRWSPALSTARRQAAGRPGQDGPLVVHRLRRTRLRGLLGFAGLAPDVQHKALFLWQKFPKFILGFLAISILATAGFFTHGQLTSLSNLSRWAFLPAFAGVGLRTNLRAPRRPGMAPAGRRHPRRDLHRTDHAGARLLELQPRSHPMTPSSNIVLCGALMLLSRGAMYVRCCCRP